MVLYSGHFALPKVILRILYWPGKRERSVRRVDAGKSGRVLYRDCSGTICKVSRLRYAICLPKWAGNCRIRIRNKNGCASAVPNSCRTADFLTPKHHCYCLTQTSSPASLTTNWDRIITGELSRNPFALYTCSLCQCRCFVLRVAVSTEIRKWLEP